jgi:hypothetical protein
LGNCFKSRAKKQQRDEKSDKSVNGTAHDGLPSRGIAPVALYDDSEFLSCRTLLNMRLRFFDYRRKTDRGPVGAPFCCRAKSPARAVVDDN